tara:strand:- start:260 stop:469 length:210 start_codon:yes stop_codon:yes gene_type:complete
MENLVSAVKDFANINYNKDGWDILVECYSDDDIAELIGNRKTIDSAIKVCRKDVKERDGYRKEIEATAF